MADLWVVNSSPLITLAKVEQLPLLMGHGRQILIPEQVAGEVMAGLEDDPARLALEGGFGTPFDPVSIDPEVLGWSLGAGESAVLSAARLLGATAILDDGAARKAARTLGIRLTGTLGLLIAGARSGQVSSATQVSFVNCEPQGCGSMIGRSPMRWPAFWVKPGFRDRIADLTRPQGGRSLVA